MSMERLEATNGVEALKIPESNPCALVVTDLLMPEIDGLVQIGVSPFVFPEREIVGIISK